MVELPPAVTDAGLNDAVGPVGFDEALKLTVPDEPISVVLTVLVPEPPCWMLSEVGLAAMVKSGGGGGAVMVTLTVVECTFEPSVPVTVTVEVPVAALPLLTVSVELLPAATEVGLTVQVALLGQPLTARLTVPAELIKVVLMVL